MIIGFSEQLSKFRITPELQQLINKSRHVHMSKEDIDEQRVSWIYGNLKGKMTKDEIRQKVLGVSFQSK
jgi:hypothetical protein